MDNRNEDNVGARHPEYDETERQRELFEDVCEGTLALREKRKKYLPKFPAESEDDYRFRCETATAFNLTRKTVDVMTGLVFKEGVKLASDVDPELVALAENIDNAGTHIDVFARRVFSDSFMGFAVILVDAPVATADSRESQMAMGLRPYWIAYEAEDVWNWRWSINPVSKSKELSLIVLRECSHEAAGQYVSAEVTRFRVFRFDGMLVTWQLYRETVNENGKTEYLLESEGALPNLSQIPVAIVGELGEEPPLMDIALKNLEHFQTYSDYKSIVHKTCVPIPVAKGMDARDDREVLVNGSTLIEMNADGDFGFAEVQGTSIEAVRQSLQDMRDDIALMGLSLLADKTARVDLTATEALLNNIGETAELRVMARSLQDAIELAFGHTAEYLGKPRLMGGSIELGTAWNMQRDEFSGSLDELEQRARIAVSLQGVMPTAWLIKLLGVTSAEEMEAILEQLRTQDAVILENMDTTENARLAGGVIGA